MVIRVQVANLTTGDRLQDLPVSNVRVESRILSPETARVRLTLKPRTHQRLDIRNATVEWKSALVVSDGQRILAAGPITDRDYDDETREWSGDAEGAWAILYRRFIMPRHATAENLLIQSGDDEGEPNPAVATNFTQKSWPFIVKALIEQSTSLDGGTLPFVFERDDGAGAHDKSYDASSFKSVGEALEDLTQLVDGPEISFIPQIVDNRLRWLVRVGDDEKLELSSPTVHSFDFTPVKRSVRRLKVKSSGSELGSVAWGTGGRQAAKALFARAFSPVLLEAGFPRLESVSSAHSTVVEQPTLQRYTDRDLELASTPIEWWSWQTDADRVPRLADLQVGDYCVVHIKGNAYLPDSPPEGFMRRIVSLSIDSATRWVTVVTDGVHTW